MVVDVKIDLGSISEELGTHRTRREDTRQDDSTTKGG